MPSDAEEARLFLKTVIPAAQRLDRRNRDEMQQVRQRLAIMSQRLEHFEKDPAQHPLDRRQQGYVDLDKFDPSPEELARRREETMQRFQESVTALAERNLSDVLKAAVNDAAPAPAQEPAKTEAPTVVAAPEANPVQTPEQAPAVAPAAPARGPGSRPAYLDEKNPKGTKFRYEPFSYRPDRPQNTKSRASTWKPSGPKTAETPLPTAADKKQAPVETKPVVAPISNPTPVPKPVAAPAPAAKPIPAAPATTSNAVPRPETTKPVNAPAPAPTPAPVPRRETPPPAAQKPEPRPVTVPTAARTPAPTAKPESRGTVTLTQKPVLPPRSITGLVIEGKQPQTPQAKRPSTEQVPARTATEAKPAKEEQIRLPLGRPDQPPPPPSPFPKKAPGKKGRRKGPDRNDGPER